jgi:hypothetical protein
MIENLQFSSRDEFRNWLNDNCLTSAGVWLLFGKPGGPAKTDAGREKRLAWIVERLN